jgi:gliding motility-associated-like protein
MKKFTLITITFLFALISNAQILITDADLDTLSPLDCNANSGPAANFFDSGNNAANYGANENEVITICPDYAGGTSKLAITFGINTGLLFGVDASDTVYVYDGPNTSSPLLGAYNTDNAPTGFNHVASFANNPSGCLTIRFISDGANEGIGWDANVTCVTIPQPFEPKMAGYLGGTGPDIINPSDTGYSDICFGDSILFVASGNYPYSSDVTGAGYSQNSGNVSYAWTFSDGTLATGDSAWFKPPARSGYIATLKITDSFPQSQSIQSKIRVSTIPSFTGVLVNRDTVCVGDTTLIVGAVTSTDTSGVDPTSSSFQLGGTFAGLTWLPDGTGSNYTTSVNVNGFLPGQTIAAASDIQKLSITMEHSYLGDLEMLLECPNGTQVTVFNSYNGGLIPGGFGGSNQHLGEAYDNNLGTPGIGWTYDFYDNVAFPTFATAFNNAAYLTTIANATTNPFNEKSIIAGDYQVEQSYAGFIGCPINGNWTITVRDNLGTDDGYIFEWGILFDPIINPNNETYVPSIVSAQWLSAATVITGLPTDTFIVVSSNNPGTFGYTMEVTDNFGCTYDTTVFVEFIPRPEIQILGSGDACAGQYQIAGTTSYQGGDWTYSGPGTATFSPGQNVENPLVNVDVNGTYTFTFTDSYCNVDSSYDIYFADSVFVALTGSHFCAGDEATLDATSEVTEASYLWSTGGTAPSIIISDSGTYYVTVAGLCNSASDSVDITTEICDIISPNVITPNGDGDNDFLFFEGLDKYPNSSLVVFNRWGKKVYENNDYLNNWSPKDLSEGTYFYILTPGGELKSDVISKTLTIFNN